MESLLEDSLKCYANVISHYHQASYLTSTQLFEVLERCGYVHRVRELQKAKLSERKSYTTRDVSKYSHFEDIFEVYRLMWNENMRRARAVTTYWGDRYRRLENSYADFFPMSPLEPPYNMWEYTFYVYYLPQGKPRRYVGEIRVYIPLPLNVTVMGATAYGVVLYAERIKDYIWLECYGARDFEYMYEIEYKGVDLYEVFEKPVWNWRPGSIRCSMYGDYDARSWSTKETDNVFQRKTVTHYYPEKIQLNRVVVI